MDLLIGPGHCPAVLRPMVGRSFQPARWCLTSLWMVFFDVASWGVGAIAPQV